MAILFTVADLPITLRPSRGKHVRLFFTALAFVLVAIWLLHKGEHGFVPWLCIVFFGAGAIIFLINLLPGASYLTLHREGFTFSSLFRVHTVKWTEAMDFSTATIANKPMVTWNYAPGAKPQSPLREINQSLLDRDAGLPDTYGQAVDDLADTMNALRAELVPPIDTLNFTVAKMTNPNL